MRRTPALIVGSGLAGAAAAAELARAGLPHLLIERSRETGDAICGGFLSWRTLETLERLGIDERTLGGVPIRRVRLYAGKRMACAVLPRAATSVSRRRLDTLMLNRAVADGARIERGVEVREVQDSVVRTGDGEQIKGDALFLASGKYDVRGAARPRDVSIDDPVLGLRVRLGPAAALTKMVGNAIELHLFEGGYAGIEMQEDGTANCCLAVHRSRLRQAGDPRSLLLELGREAEPLGERIAFMASDATIDAIANVPYGWRALHGQPGMFRLGDQAAVIPSLAGEGMGIALASARAAVSAYRKGGAPASIAWQRDFARRTARPVRVAGMVRDLAEGRAAPLMLFAANPAIIRLVARLTRIRSP